MTDPGGRPTLRIRGARTHNLRGFDLDVPTGELVVVTGPSGSGKSSLAFGTIHAESVRRFAAATRTYEGSLTTIDPPDVDSIDGLGVTVALSQRSVTRSARSTVATLAGVAEPIRRVYSALGSPGCPRCGGVGVRYGVSDVVDALTRLSEGTRITLLAEVARGALGDARETLSALSRGGFARARVDGTIVSLDDVSSHPKRIRRSVEVVVDRLAVRLTDVPRLREAVLLAYETGRGQVIVAVEGGEELSYSDRPICSSCGTELALLDPATFRRSDPRSACPRCGGSGLADESTRGSRTKTKASKPSEEDETLPPPSPDCATCEGFGFHGAALDVRALGLTFRSMHTLAASELVLSLDTADAPRVAKAALDSLRSVVRFLVDVGLGHVALGRRAPTLSGGELSRVRLAGLLANDLVGVTYVLDEPTAGLHALERPPIVRAMRGLVSRGNTVICVEHDRDVLAAADLVVELGPGAGIDGGALLVASTRDALPESSLSRRVLSGDLAPWERTARPPGEMLTLRGIRVRPFAGMDLAIPRARLTFLTGPSGSGKTTLLGLLARAHGALATGGAVTEFASSAAGFDGLARCVRLDDASAWPGLRSFVATRLGVFTRLRELFAGLPESRVRGFDASTFGLASGGSRCEVCLGLGTVSLPAVAGLTATIECERCRGGRYDDVVLETRYHGLTIADVLRGTVDDSLARFEAIPKIHRPLAAAVRLGLGHLTLGRPLADTSGGELVRLRLASELGGRTSTSLILLDEPTRGLHAVDVRRLVDALDELVTVGATLVVADHALDAIACADHVVDLDLDSDARRAFVAAEGSPMRVAAEGSSPTGRALSAR